MRKMKVARSWETKEEEEKRKPLGGDKEAVIEMGPNEKSKFFRF